MTSSISSRIKQPENNRFRFPILLGMVLIFLAGCMSSGVKTPSPGATALQPAAPGTSPGPVPPVLLAEWITGYVNDLAWSPDGSMFVVNSHNTGDAFSTIQAFDVKSLNKMWVTEDSFSHGLAFSPKGEFIAEPDLDAGLINVRSAGQGRVVRQVKANCGGGGYILSNPAGNTFLVAENDVTGLNSSYFINVDLWDLDTGLCRNLIESHGYLFTFDVNARGDLIAMGEILPDGHTVIWDEQKRAEVCHTSVKGDYGLFVPGQNALALISGQKIVFIDTSTCQELRELNVNLIFPTDLAFSPDGRLLAVGGPSLLWDPPAPSKILPVQIMETLTGRMVTQVPIPEEAVGSPAHSGLGGLVFSPDGQLLLLAFSTNANGVSHDKVQLWQLQK